jgi:ABC-type nickel/cobalt efflux system permease component RcnA
VTELGTILQQGSANAWLFVPSAILLGALHGLEPGHSKTMMAAFIISIRGSVAQAVLLGLAATLSHTALVWLVALLGLYFGRQWNEAAYAPWLQLVCGLFILSIAVWMIVKTRQHLHHTHDHGHAHQHHGAEEELEEELDLATGEHMDAHELEHANDIRRRFSNREVSNGQILMFGLTGGLIPCPASIAVLLLCLQLRQFMLGAALVLCFSIGLALTLVLSGVMAALSVKHIAKRWSGYGEIARRAPYLSGGLISLVGLYVGLQGLQALLYQAR